MQPTDRGPHYLAEVVQRALSATEAKSEPRADAKSEVRREARGETEVPIDAPDKTLLGFFFDVLYQTSFRPAPGCAQGHTTGSVLWQDPATLQRESSALPVSAVPAGAQAWSYLALIHPIPFNIGSLAALAQGLDPRISALTVYASPGQGPAIHGLVNYAADPSLPQSRAWEVQPRPPGSFRVQILGPAHLAVDVGFEYPIELKRSRLYTHAHAILRRGPVRARLSEMLGSLFPLLKSQLSPETTDSPFFDADSLPLPGGGVLINDDDWPERLERLWTDALVQLLLHIFQDRQGGAVLITSYPAAPGKTSVDRREDQRGSAYPTAHSQLRLLLEQHSIYAITQHVRAAEALSQWSLPSGREIPPELALRESELPAGPAGSDQEIRRAVAFLAGLARIEGALILTPQLDLLGFGAQPNAGRTSEEVHLEQVYLAGDEAATDEELTPISYRSFGPRNQALLQQCDQDHKAIAFALTQDGEMRAMMHHEGKLIVWDRISLS